MNWVLRFPTDRICGRLYRGRLDATRRDWHILSDAYGTVDIPTDLADEAQELILQVNRQGTDDLSFLARFDPEALGMLDLGDTLIRDSQLDDVVTLSGLRGLRLSRSMVTDQGLAQLSPLRNLRRLSLAGVSNLSDAGLAHLATFVQLKHLDLALTRFDGTGLAHLQILPDLVSLNLMGMRRLIEMGWAEVGRLRALRFLDLSSSAGNADERLGYLQRLDDLEELNLARNRLDGSGLVYLAHLSHLRTLHLSQCPLQPDHLVHLRNLPFLEELSLVQVPPIDAEGIAHVAHAPALRRLNLYEALDSSDGLAHLLHAPALRELDLSGCVLDDAGLALLGQLTCLRALRLSGAAGVTDRGITHLA